MNFYEALRFCYEEDLPIKQKDGERMCRFVGREDGVSVLVNENRKPPLITSRMLKAEWEEADVREKV